MLCRLRIGRPLAHSFPLREPLLRRASDAAGGEGAAASSSFTLSYLVNSCGIPPELAPAAAKQADFKSSERADAVLQLLRSRGLSQSQVADCVRKHPNLLRTDAENVLRPKFEALEEVGFSAAVLAEMLSKYPGILEVGVKNGTLSKILAFVKTLVPKEADFIRVLSHCPWLIGYNTFRWVAPNVDLLLNEGVPMKNVSYVFKSNSRLFSNQHSQFVKVVQIVKNMGFHPSNIKFMLALIVRSYKKTYDRNFKVYKSLGLTDDQILSAFKSQPLILMMSEKKIRKIMGYFVGVRGIAPCDVLKTPTILLFSLEKRIIPRCKVLEVLAERGILSSWNMRYVLQPNDKQFLAKYVIKYKEEIPELMNLYSANVVQ